MLKHKGKHDPNVINISGQLEEHGLRFQHKESI